MFGYNKLAVSSCISELESEYNQKIQDLQKESSEAQDTLRSQIQDLQKESSEAQDTSEKPDPGSAEGKQ